MREIMAGMWGAFAQRYVKRHELAQPFQADFEGLSGYVRGNIGSAPSPDVTDGISARWFLCP